jgi:hypothetical protein
MMPACAIGERRVEWQNDFLTFLVKTVGENGTSFPTTCLILASQLNYMGKSGKRNDFTPHFYDDLLQNAPRRSRRLQDMVGMFFWMYRPGGTSESIVQRMP